MSWTTVPSPYVARHWTCEACDVAWFGRNPECDWCGTTAHVTIGKPSIASQSSPGAPEHMWTGEGV